MVCMKGSEVKVCVVGCGKWGRNHVRTLDQLGALGGIVDSDQAALTELREQHRDLQTFSTVEEALKSGDFDGYVVATPAHTHCEIAVEIINAGIHVLVEKPVAMTKQEVRLLKTSAAAKNVNLMAGHLLLFHPAIRAIKDMITSGAIGRLQYMYSNRLNMGTVRSEENRGRTPN